MSIKDRLRKTRLDNNMTLEDLAQKVGVSRQTIQRYESGVISNIPSDKIELMASALGTTPAHLMGWTDEISDGLIPNFPNIYPVKTVSLPILGSVSCGVPKFAEEEHISYIKADSDIRADFCLIADGDSMTGARIHDGDVVFVRKQPTVENGEIAVVCVDDETLLKTVYHYKEKNMLVLRAENRLYDDLVYVGNELEKIRILGKVVSVKFDID